MAVKQQAKKNRKSLILRIFLFAFVIYSVVVLVEIQVAVAERREELIQLEERLETQRIANKELLRQLELGIDDEEMERIARERLEYVSPDERVFIDISGS